jgi:hypothetical protein
MGRQTAAKKPFFAYVPYTQVHMPTIPSPDYQNKTYNGDFADVLAEMDAHVGQLLDAVGTNGLPVRPRAQRTPIQPPSATAVPLIWRRLQHLHRQSEPQDSFPSS